MITLEQGIELARKFEKILSLHGYHCGITGSLLHRGTSDKDLDLIIYPKYSSMRIAHSRLLEKLGLTFVEIRNHRDNGDYKEVIHTEYEGLRVDCFFLQ